MQDKHKQPNLNRQEDTSCLPEQEIQVEVESTTCTTLTGASNDELVRKSKLLKDKVQNLESDLRDAQRKVKGRARSLTQIILSPNIADDVLRADRSVKFCTVLVSLAMFQATWTFFLSMWQPKLPARFQPEEQFLIMLMRLRLGQLTEDISCRFAAPLCTSNKRFYAWSDIMVRNSGKLVVWPIRKAIKLNLPNLLKILLLRI